MTTTRKPKMTSENLGKYSALVRRGKEWGTCARPATQRLYGHVYCTQHAMRRKWYAEQKR